MKLNLKLLANKYVITGVVFIVWVVFFDQNDYMTMQARKKELNAVKSNIAYLNGEINRMETERNDLITNPKKLEQYARETYRMKHDNEDVYVLETPTK